MSISLPQVVAGGHLRLSSAGRTTDVSRRSIATPRPVRFRTRRHGSPPPTICQGRRPAQLKLRYGWQKRRASQGTGGPELQAPSRDFNAWRP